MLGQHYRECGIGNLQSCSIPVLPSGLPGVTSHCDWSHGWPEAKSRHSRTPTGQGQSRQLSRATDVSIHGGREDRVQLGWGPGSERIVFSWVGVSPGILRDGKPVDQRTP